MSRRYSMDFSIASHTFIGKSARKIDSRVETGIWSHVPKYFR